MITAEEAEKIGLVNRVISLNTEEDLQAQPSRTPTVSKQSSTNLQEEQQYEQQQEKQRVNELAKVLNKKLIDKSISLAKEIANNSFMAVKTGKMLINKGMDADIDTGLQLEIYGWALCFAHEDRQKMMSAFLNKSKKK
jgi:3-hydroxypropionyl-coenzyme A dehydratase